MLHLSGKDPCVCPVIYTFRAFARLGHRREWCTSRGPRSVVRACGGHSSVEAWNTTALDIEEPLSGTVDSDVHFVVADSVKSFDTVDRGALDSVLSCMPLEFLIAALYLPWCNHAKNFLCVTRP